MSDVKKVNGYLIKQLQTDAWWVLESTDEPIAGPFGSEAAAIEIEVANVLQDQPSAPVRKRKNNS